MTTPDEKAAAALLAEMQSVLLPEVQYHYNAMKALSGLSMEGVGTADRAALIDVSIAWSLLGLLRAKMREV